MPSRRAEPAASAGFSLIEALVALVVVGLAAAAIAEVFGIGLLGYGVSREAATALSLAEAEIAAAGTAEPLKPGRQAGVFAGRFHWQRTIATYDDHDKDLGAGFTPGAPDLRLYRIAMAVDWQEGRRLRHVQLVTMRLGPPPP